MVLGAAGVTLLRTPLDAPLSLLVLMVGVSLIVTAFPEITMPAASRLVASVALAYGLIFWARTPARLRWFGQAMMLMGCTLALLSPFIVDWMANKAFLLPSSVYQYFPLLVSDGVHPNTLAAAIVLLLPFPVASMLRVDHSSLWPRIGLGLVSAAMAITLVLTKSRGGYIAAAVAIIVVAWLSRQRRWAVALSLLALVAAASLILAGTMVAPPDAVTSFTDPSTFAFRLNVWQTALWMIRDFPFSGAGMGTFNEVGALLYPFNETRNPGTHSWYLQVGVDLGLPGLVALLATLMLALVLGHKALRRFYQVQETDFHALTAGAVAGLVGLMVHGLVDNSLWNSRGASFPWAAIALLIGLYRWSQRSDELDVDW